MRLIDADEFDKTLESGEIEAHKNKAYVYEGILNTIRGNLANAPTIDPVKHGRWIYHDGIKNIYGGKYIECDQCGEKYVVQHIADEKFCRNCGAKMD